MITDTVHVSYPGGRYPIYIGKQLLNNTELLAQHLAGNQIMIVTNDRVAPLYFSRVHEALKSYHSDQLILPDGEVYKTLTEWNKILDALANHNHHRDTTLIALGGGVIGDMTGFAAACYQRGVAFIQIPTTLLAQVDASIGGKTGINHAKGKNLIGAFHQPQAVIIDTDTLSTLPDREYRSGIAEIIKAALIKDATFFAWLEDNMDALLARDYDVLVKAIKQACIIKRDIVAIDEKEHGERALLNLGHTFGHAVEHCLDYRGWLHGEAVAWGMLRAAELSVKLNLLTLAELTRIHQLLTRAHLLMTLPEEIFAEQLLIAMQGDKKILGNKLRLIILDKIGHGIITNQVSMEQLREILQVGMDERMRG